MVTGPDSDGIYTFSNGALAKKLPNGQFRIVKKQVKKNIPYEPKLLDSSNKSTSKEETSNNSNMPTIGGGEVEDINTSFLNYWGKNHVKISLKKAVGILRNYYRNK